MLLSIAAVLTIFGLLLFATGEVFSYQAVAVIGAVVILGVGGSIVTGGLEHRTGEVETQISENETVTDYETSPVQTQSQFPLALLVMLAGGVAALRALDSGGS
jgi:hypothetical protein